MRNSSSTSFFGLDVVELIMRNARTSLNGVEADARTLDPNYATKIGLRLTWTGKWLASKKWHATVLNEADRRKAAIYCCTGHLRVFFTPPSTNLFISVKGDKFDDRLVTRSRLDVVPLALAPELTTWRRFNVNKQSSCKHRKLSKCWYVGLQLDQGELLCWHGRRKANGSLLSSRCEIESIFILFLLI